MRTMLNTLLASRLVQGKLRLFIAVFIFVACTRVTVYSQSCAPFGWHAFGDVFYLAESDIRTYESAKTTCQNYGGDLAEPKTQAINSFLTGIINVNTFYWIGLDDTAVNGTFRWSDGTQSDSEFSPWNDDEPGSTGNEDCVVITSSTNGSNGEWYNRDCGTTLQYICERRAVLSSSWYTFGNSMYYKEILPASYNNARSYCQCLGGDLAQLKTPEINTFVVNIPGGQWFWFGLDDLAEEGTFMWVDGTVFGTSFPSWINGGLDNYKNKEDCVHTAGFARWNDISCAMVYTFVCERSKYLEPVTPIHLLAVTSTPYGGSLDKTRYMCLLSPPDDVSGITSLTQRHIKLSETACDATLTVPGINAAVLPNSLPVMINQSLPSDNTAVGVFRCSATNAKGRTTSAFVTILSDFRRFQPADGRFTKTLYIGDNITLSVTERETGVPSDIRWTKFMNLATGALPGSDGDPSHTITSATMDDANVYGTYVGGSLGFHRFSLIRLIVFDCPPGRWDPSTCLGICDNCYNGGVCHQLSGTCICPPGFAGRNCLTACGENRYGWECELECGPGMILDVCAGSEFCMPDPYGCNCLAGYTGIYCNHTCTPGQFGVDCTQDCHCSQGSPCNIYTGECPGDCDDGWSGPSCRVPSVCPVGYHGANCTENCNCPNNVACEKVTGYCSESDGICAVGYSADSTTMIDNCILFSGCFESCSKTCHCSGGVSDCNSVTGYCFSSKCHPRWTGDKCQTDRFQTLTRKTNPGQSVFVSCTVTAATDGQLLAPGDIKIAIADSLAELRTFSYVASYVACKTRQNSFLIENIQKDDVIYCYVGVPQNKTSFASARVQQLNFVLPVLKKPPSLLGLGLDYIMIGWTTWNKSMDIGDGPITGYNIYTSNGSGNWTLVGYEAADITDDASNAHYVIHNVTGLQPDTVYALSVSTIREGRGEGTRGPELIARTRRNVTTHASMTLEDTSVVSTQSGMTSLQPNTEYTLSVSTARDDTEGGIAQRPERTTTRAPATIITPGFMTSEAASPVSTQPSVTSLQQNTQNTGEETRGPELTIRTRTNTSAHGSMLPEDTSSISNQSNVAEKQIGIDCTSHDTTGPSWALFAISGTGNAILGFIIIILCFRRMGSKSQTPSMQGSPMTSPCYTHPSPSIQDTNIDTCEDFQSRDNEDIDSYSLNALILN